MTEVPQQIVTFNHELAREIEAGIEKEENSRLPVMNNAAEAVLAHSGICDEPTFMTAFFGGFINSGVNWDTQSTNERLLARDVDPKVHHAFEVAKVVSASVGEPFLRYKLDTGYADQIGLVLPGSPNWAYSGIKYSVERDSGGSRAYIGRMVFNGYLAGRKHGNKPVPRIEEVALLELERRDANVTVASDASRLILGTAAVRMSFGMNAGYHEYYDSVESHIARLRSSVWPYIDYASKG